MSYYRTGKQCWGSPQSQSRWWCQSRCVSRQQRPPPGRKPWTVWVQREALPHALGWGWAEYGAWAVPQQGRKGSWSRVKPRKGRSPKVSSKAQALQCLLPESILHSLCFQSALQCQLPFLSSVLEGRNLTISCPPTHSCLLHCCRLAAPLWSEFPMTPSPTSEARTPPRPFEPPAPPWLLAHSFQPWPICPLAPLDSLVPPAPLWSGIDPPVPQVSTRPAAPRPFVPLAPSGSFIPSAPPQSSVAPAPPRISGSPSPPRSPVLSAPPWSPGSSLLLFLYGSLSPPQTPPPPAPPLLVGPLESAAITSPWHSVSQPVFVIQWCESL